MSGLEDKMTGNWNQISGKVKEKWGDITDDDLKKSEGKLEQLVGKIQEKTGETKENIRAWINENS